MTARRLTPQDAAAYRRLMLQAYEQHPDAFTSSVAERAALPIAWWEQRLAPGDDAPELVLGSPTPGSTGGALAGVVGLSFDRRDKARHKATLFGMVVPAPHRRQGLGRALVQAALHTAAARSGVRLVQLTVSEGNVAAQTLYASCGFVPFGLEPMAVAVPGGFVAKLHMWQPLPWAHA